MNITGLEYYAATVLIFACINAIAALGFNLQIGHAGIVNLAILVLISAGGYMTGIAAMPPPPHDGFTQYIGGFGWAFPWNVLFGAGCAGALSALLGLVALRRLRADYLALTLVAILEGLQVLVTSDRKLFNGTTGLINIPAPFIDQLDPATFQWVFGGICLVALVVTYWIIARVTSSPIGRAIKAAREDEEAVASLGRDPWAFKMVAFVIGGCAAGLAGGLTALYATGWSPAAWLPQESLLLLTVVIIGGRGRNLGAVVGSFVVYGLIVQASSLLPPSDLTGRLPELQTLVLGALLLIFLWFRPEGILPESKEKFPARRDQPPPVATAVGASEQTANAVGERVT